MVVPGTFNLSKMAEFVTPGVSMFLSLPIAADSIAAYENFVVTASNLAAKLDGDLKDENRSVLTKQAIEHARQRVMEYERKRKLAKS
jgi:cell division protein ZipA